MNNNILIQTTFKNSTFLLLPFYKFYTDIWKPKKIVFHIGYTEDILNEETIINEIISKFKKPFTIKNITDKYNHYIHNLKLLDNNEDIIVFLYKTEHYVANIWNLHVRSELYKLPYKILKFENFDFYLNTDNDDFFYVKNINEYLSNWEENKNHFHAMEFVAHETFNIQDDFDFISWSYYFRSKGVKNHETAYDFLKNKSNHHWCRLLYLKDKFRNESHPYGSKSDPSRCYKESCKIFDDTITESQNFNTNIDRICFSFACVDLNFLLNHKHWLGSHSHVSEMYKHEKKIITEHFYNNYLLSEEELKNKIVLKCNFLKKYFE